MLHVAHAHNSARFQGPLCYGSIGVIFHQEVCLLSWRDKARSVQYRVVHGSILCDQIQPNPLADWPNPIQPNESGKIWTQPDPIQLLLVYYYYLVGYSITHSLFYSKLKTYFRKSFPSFFFFMIHYMDSPDCLLLFLSISVFYFLVFLSLHFLVVVSVR